MQSIIEHVYIAVNKFTVAIALWEKALLLKQAKDEAHEGAIMTGYSA